MQNGDGTMKADYIIRESIIHIRKIVQLIENRGIVFVIRMLISTFFGYWYYKIFKSKRAFLFQKRKHSYYYHHYNVTWMSERAVEIPIIRGIVDRYTGKRILEIGNVLNHYFEVNHDVVDKYEGDKNVINQDVVDFETGEKYDLIVSISTLEHIGWDEHLFYHNKEPQKIKRAFDSLLKCLAPDGELVMTYPVGYNPVLDRLTDTGELKWTKILCMKRVSADNAWVETQWSDTKNARYDNPYISANGLVVGYFRHSDNDGKQTYL
jgi:SAM-dependent methyltransferase